MYRIAVTGRCDSDDYVRVSTRILSIAPSDEPVTVVLSGKLDTLNDVVVAIAGYRGWEIEANLDVLDQSNGVRLRHIAESGLDHWVIFGRNMGPEGGPAGRLARMSDVLYTVDVGN